MAIRQSGSRRIVVDGVPYRWRVRPKPTYGQECLGGGLTFAVAHAEHAGATLVVCLPHAHPRQRQWMQQPVDPVLPAAVAGSIRLALAQGWTPCEPGRQFVLRLIETDPQR